MPKKGNVGGGGNFAERLPVKYIATIENLYNIEGQSSFLTIFFFAFEFTEKAGKYILTI